MSRHGGRRPASGFTLVEVMVVLLIVGLAIGGLTLGMDALRGRDAELAVEKLQHALEAAAERASVRGQPIALQLLQDGYRFERYDADGGWRPYADPPLFVERRLPAPLAWEGLRIGGVQADAGNRIVFSARPPRYELSLAGLDGGLRLRGRETGAVDRLPARSTP